MHAYYEVIRLENTLCSEGDCKGGISTLCSEIPLYIAAVAFLHANYLLLLITTNANIFVFILHTIVYEFKLQ